MNARMDNRHPPPNDRVFSHLFYSASEAAHDRDSVASGLVVFVLYALLLLLVIGPVGHHILKIETDPGVGTGIGAGAAGGGGGGQEETIISLEAPAMPAPAAQTAPVPPPPPDPALQLPPIEVPKVVLPPTQLASVTMALPALSACLANGEGTGSGAGSGPGTGPGTGGGSGGGSGGGIGSNVGKGIGRGRLLSASPDYMLLPPMPAPGSVHGKTVQVRVAIDASGTVRDCEVLTSSGDRGYDQALRKTAMAWHFHPARDASNNAVPSTYDVSFTL